MNEDATFYLPRMLTDISDSEKTYTEEDLLRTSSHVIVLAEPGAGKTELMKSLARKLSTSAIEANAFRYRDVSETGVPLVIDGFDELAKIDKAGIHQLLSLAKKANPTNVIVSSRSSEWSDASTSQFRKYFNIEPRVVRLCEFRREEQQALFQHRHPDENVNDFFDEVCRFGLDLLLANPQFLNMLASAYKETGRQFTSREAIFSQAVRYQAREANNEIATDDAPLSVEQIITLSAEVFAKLLLSGAQGIATRDLATEDERVYPSLFSLTSSGCSPKGILASRLFKPGSMADRHRPVHKIIAEYCAAVYLCKRIDDPADPLTLRKCLNIIAPGHYVRDELRGLLGWMASSGSTATQKDIIRLDPYAVIANGDPSRLGWDARVLLIHQLQKLEQDDPYFRRSDAWRRFNVSGFFTPEVIEAVRPVIEAPGKGHLRDLLLELLAGAPEVAGLCDSLSFLLCNKELTQHTRWLAGNCLLSVKSYDFVPDLNVLIAEATSGTLHIAADIITVTGPHTYPDAFLATFLQACTGLYPDHRGYLTHNLGSYYFVGEFIGGLSAASAENLLDILSDGLTCTCHKERYECDCRNGISKIIGKLLDNYLSQSTAPRCPQRIWQWIENLNFHSPATDSIAVRVLQQDDGLRRAIYRHVLAGESDREKIRKGLNTYFSYADHGHSGLNFTPDDQSYLLNMAFEESNVSLWLCLFPHHFQTVHKREKQSNPLRRLCRIQAKQDDRFLQAWVSAERGYKASYRPDRKTHRKIRRHRKRHEAAEIVNLRYIETHREAILASPEWDLLQRFAQTWLSKPETIPSRYGDADLVEQALINCIPHILQFVPDLQALAEINGEGKIYAAERLFYVASLVLFEKTRSLESIPVAVLRTLRTASGYGGGQQFHELAEAMRAEIDRLIFPAGQGTESFLREYLEPQLTAPCPSLGLMISSPVFSSVRGELAVEWLERFSTLSLYATQRLFVVANHDGKAGELAAIVAKRYAGYQQTWFETAGDANQEELRLFWLIRAFYYLPTPSPEYWQWLIADQQNLLRLYSLSGRINRGEYANLPQLTPEKHAVILEGFIDAWRPAYISDSHHSRPHKLEDAWRFLQETVYSLGTSDPDDAIPVVRRLLDEHRMLPLKPDLQSVLTTLQREKMLRNYAPPTPLDIVEMLDKNAVVTVEGLRETVLFHLEEYQRHVRHGEFNTLTLYYPAGKRLDEESSTDIIADWLSNTLRPQGISVIKEHEVNSEKRADFSATKMHRAKRLLLMAEVKGQWNKDLFTAASEQLYQRYSLTPDADMQGIYVALWFGKEEKVANALKHGLSDAAELKQAIIENMPADLHKQIDVFVLDLARKPA